jgi:uncharacterized caspase-like protein
MGHRSVVLAKLFLTIVILMAGFAVPAIADKRVALVVGNSAYQHVGSLTNTVNDAEQMARMLTAAGFDVQHHRDLPLAEFRWVVRAFADRSQDSDYALVFFAGHGIEVDGTNYLIPIDAQLASDFDIEDETISLDRVLSAIEPAKQLRMVILDACRNNPFVPKMRRYAAKRSIGRGLARVEPTVSNTLVAFAAKAGSTADDGQGSNSPYTAALLKHIALPGLDLRIAMGRVRDEVMASTGNRQEPYIFGSLGGSMITLSDAVSGATQSNVTSAAPPSDPEAGTRRDYELASRIGNAEALRIFVTRHPAGYYADLARNQLAKLTKPEPAAEPVQGDMKIPVEFAGRSFTISATEIRDLVPGALGAPRLQRQVSIEIDPIGRFKGNNRGLRPDGTQTMNVFFTGRLNEGGPRSWKIEDGRLMGQSLVPGFHWSATVRPTAKGCAAEMAYKLPPGKKVLTLTNPNTGASFDAKSIRLEGITCTVKNL